MKFLVNKEQTFRKAIETQKARMRIECLRRVVEQKDGNERKLPRKITIPEEWGT